MFMRHKKPQPDHSPKALHRQKVIDSSYALAMAVQYSDLWNKSPQKDAAEAIINLKTLHGFAQLDAADPAVMKAFHELAMSLGRALSGSISIEDASCPPNVKTACCTFRQHMAYYSMTYPEANIRARSLVLADVG